MFAWQCMVTASCFDFFFLEAYFSSLFRYRYYKMKNLILVWYLSCLLHTVKSTLVDPKGYIMYCPCMG